MLQQICNNSVTEYKFLEQALSTPVFRPWLFKGWIELSSGLISVQWIMQLVSLILIRWIVIYLVDSPIRRLNNRGQQTSTIHARFLTWPLGRNYVIIT